MAEATKVEIQMPAMGESVTEGVVLEWHKSEGEFVEEGETVVEVSTDKVDAEVPAPASGVLTKIMVQVDETVKVGQTLAEIDPNGSESEGGGGGGDDQGDGGGDGDGSATETDDSQLIEGGGEGDQDLGDDDVDADSPQPGQDETVSAGSDASEPSPDTAASGETVVIAMPEMGESVTEGTVLEYHVAEGDSVEEGQTIVEVSTDKVDAEVPAPSSGTITKLSKAPDDVVKVGEALAEMTAGAGAAPAEPAATDGSAAEAPAEPASTPVSDDDGNGNASPVARRIAADKGIDVSSIKGSGAQGKVMKADVLAAGNGDGAAPAAVQSTGDAEAKALRGPAGMLAAAMNESREMPTATSFRTLPVDTIDAKRKALNAVLKDRGMKLSFTHMVAWAIVRAATEAHPSMAHTYEERDGKPFLIDHGSVNLGIAVDVERKGARSLMVPCIKGASGLDFKGFHSAFEELINKTRENKLTADDFQGTNITLTNPGGIGTIASVPRLMKGQGTIVATGSIAYPVEWTHAPPEKIRALGVSKVMTMTSTYDHRIIQGAESGSFLRRIDQLLQGEDGFYEAIAENLEIDEGVVKKALPASASAPALGAAGTAPGESSSSFARIKPDTELLQAVQAATSLLKAYRTHGHLAGNLNPLDPEGDGDPSLDPANLNLTPELMEQIPASILRIGVEGETLLDALPRMRSAYCGTIGYQIEHLSSHQQRMWLREMIETDFHRQLMTDDQKRQLLVRLIEVFQFERFVQKAYLGQKMFSIEGLDVVVPMLDEVATISREEGAIEVVIGMAHRGRLSVLAHNLGRPLDSIFAEFEGAKALEVVKRAMPHRGTGDVKYHHGAEGLLQLRDGDTIKMRLYPEPEPPRVRRSRRRRRHPGRPDPAHGADHAPRPQCRRAGPAAW